MILDGYPIPWAIRFGKLASLLLRMNIEPLAQICRFYVPEVEPDETSFWERRGPMESIIMRLMIFPCLVPSRVPHEPISPFFQRPSAILGVGIHNTRRVYLYEVP
jgi:hypothetical protein